jgi:hypothetical protein
LKGGVGGINTISGHIVYQFLISQTTVSTATDHSNKTMFSIGSEF